MLLQAARSQCRFAGRNLHSSRQARSWYPSRQSNLYNGRQTRIFTTGGNGRWKSQDGGERPQSRRSTEPKKESQGPGKAENAKSSGSAQQAKKQKSDLLNETTVANKEQRKADWAIMKEMAHYLWPKVTSVGHYPPDSMLNCL